MLNKTSSTEGIASKKSLELKKRYLLGEAAVSATNAGLIKSDSSSVLDTKFKNFHSNISAGQKMLSTTSHSGPTKAGLVHSVTTDMNAVRQSFVWNAPNGPIPTAMSATSIPLHNCSDGAIHSTPSATTSVLPLPHMSPTTRASTSETNESHVVPSKPAAASSSIRIASHSDEKENINTDANQPPADTQTTLSTHLQTSPTDSPCIRSTVATPARNAILYDSIDLCTPPEKSPEVRRIQLADEMCVSQEFNRKLDQNARYGEMSTDEAQLMASKSTSSIDSSAELEAAERSKVTIDTMLNSRAASTITMTKPTKPAKATSTAASTVHPAEFQWKAFDRRTSDAARTIIEVDSLSSSTPSSSSSTSSIEEIPHYVLESTTSPDTMLVKSAAAEGPHLGNAPTSAAAGTPPQLSVCKLDDAQLMQIDSLMIVDGHYVGDPEDLEHMQLPGDVRCAKASYESTETTRSVVATQSPPFIEPPLLPISSSFRSVDAPSTKSQTSVLQQYRSSSRRPELRFDTRNANKIDTLRNMPMISPTNQRPIKPNQLHMKPEAAVPVEFIDLDKTPTAVAGNILASTTSTDAVSPTMSDRLNQSDSETEDVTNAGLTETELSDWAADDAVSENFVEIEFVLNSNKGTIRRNKRNKAHGKHHYEQASAECQAPSTTALAAVSSAMRCPLAKNLDMDDIEFMDTGSEDSCLESYSATNQAMIRNRGYVQFVANSKLDVDQTAERLMLLGVSYANPFASGADVYSCRSDAGYGSSPKDSLDRMAIEDDVKQRPGVDYIEQGACILGKNSEFFLSYMFS